jgi:hypothetical protein
MADEANHFWLHCLAHQPHAKKKKQLFLSLVNTATTASDGHRGFEEGSRRAQQPGSGSTAREQATAVVMEGSAARKRLDGGRGRLNMAVAEGSAAAAVEGSMAAVAVEGSMAAKNGSTTAMERWVVARESGQGASRRRPGRERWGRWWLVPR